MYYQDIWIQHTCYLCTIQIIPNLLVLIWHRDLEDYFYPMIKIMIPLTETSEENWSICSFKRVCPYKSKIIETSEFLNSRFDKMTKIIE